MGQLLTIGEVARRGNVTVDTVRYYERLGLLPRAARTPAGYRQYPEAVIQRLALVRHAQRFGFSLADIAGFLRVRDAGGRPCRAVRSAGERLLAAVDAQIAELQTARARMRETLDQWDARLARTPSNRPARLLETLSSD